MFPLLNKHLDRFFASPFFRFFLGFFQGFHFRSPAFVVSSSLCGQNYSFTARSILFYQIDLTPDHAIMAGTQGAWGTGIKSSGVHMSLLSDPLRRGSHMVPHEDSKNVNFLPSPMSKFSQFFFFHPIMKFRARFPGVAAACF